MQALACGVNASGLGVCSSLLINVILYTCTLIDSLYDRTYCALWFYAFNLVYIRQKSMFVNAPVALAQNRAQRIRRWPSFEH